MKALVVFVATLANLQRRAVQRFGTVEVALAMQHHGQVVHRHRGMRALRAGRLAE